MSCARTTCEWALTSAFVAVLSMTDARAEQPAESRPRAEKLEQEYVRITGKVTAISGTNIYIDLGRDDKVQIGDTALFFPAGVTSIEGTVRSIAKNSSRVELAPGSPSVETGVRVEVLVPKERITPKPAPPQPGEPTQAQPAPPAQPTPPDESRPVKPPPVHPPWSQPPEGWASDRPLLATAFGVKPEERPTIFSGRAWLDLHDTHDDVGGSKEYFLGRAGTNLRVDNPFGHGGTFEFDGEVLQRTNSFPDQPDDSDTQLSVRRLSYVVGDTREDPTRFEIGRFYAHEFPELGTIDGVEWARRASGGSRFGVNAGGLPTPFPDAHTFQDYGISVFGRYAADERERLTFGAALQKSWHEGNSDRDLVVLQNSWRPAKSFAWSTSAWLDYYTSSDTEKSSGFELTEISSQARWTIAPGWGTSLRLAHRRYPQLLREDFAGISPELLRDGKLDRGAFTLWHDFSDRVRVDARVDGWQDQDDSGTNYELGTTLRDLLYEHGSVNVSAFQSDGTFSSGEGVRASASRSWERTFGSLGYEYANFDQKGFVGSQANLAHQAVFGSLDLPLGEKWNVSLSGDTRFGDQQDSWSIGLMLQLRY